MRYRHFYPRSPCGERLARAGRLQIVYYFYPRSPCGERPVTGSESQKLILHFYPRSPCGERLGAPVDRMPSSSISIHALLAESDHSRKRKHGSYYYFYPRSPCGERRRRLWLLAQTASFLSTLSLRRATPRSRKTDRLPPFLSTLSLRRATRSPAAGQLGAVYFYPRSPCGERRRHYLVGLCRTSISIHALLAESDSTSPGHPGGSQRYFYPRSPCGERLLPSWDLYQMLRISIHALLAESDRHEKH